MVLIVDSREKDGPLKEAADRVELLNYPNPSNPGAPYSYDVKVITRAGETLTFERKRSDDFVESFLGGKLDRQCSIVDALIVEWDELDILSKMPSESGKQKAFLGKYRAARLHLDRMSLSMPVIQTRSIEETLATLKYFESLEKPSGKFENKVSAVGATVLEKMVRGASPSIDCDTYRDGILPLIDVDLLLRALKIEKWPLTMRVKNRILEAIKNEMETPDS